MRIYVFISMAALALVTYPKEGVSEPEFAEPIPNVTVSVGSDVSLPCVVDDLGDHRVAWIYKDRYTLLTVHYHVISSQSRYRITHKNLRTWWLHIANVQESDEGEYICQINTSPMKKQAGYIKVVDTVTQAFTQTTHQGEDEIVRSSGKLDKKLLVPPKIDQKETSSNTEVREGNDVSLRCVANGSPDPEITWRREDNQEFMIGEKKVTSIKGPYLNITKVTLLNTGTYLCTATNGVQPHVTQGIVLLVEFPPMMFIPNQLVRGSINGDAILECDLESLPRSFIFWYRDGDPITHTSDKYRISVHPQGLYKEKTRLTVRNLKLEDFGLYTCVAKNPLGDAEGSIRLYAPLEIDEDETSSNTEVLEGSDVSLRCVANGSPDPEITWRREDNQEIMIGENKVTSIKGPYLNVTKVTRLHMGTYLCTASNGMPSSVSKGIALFVKFASTVLNPNQTVSASINTDVTLECDLESFPQPITDWYRDGDTMLHTNDKYRISLQSQGLYKMKMSLTIRNLKPDDLRLYTCVAKNPLRETEGSIRLYGSTPKSLTFSGLIDSNVTFQCQCACSYQFT